MGKRKSIYEYDDTDGRNIYRPDPNLAAAQAEIARLQAEVERLTGELTEAKEGWHVEMPNAPSNGGLNE